MSYRRGRVLQVFPYHLSEGTGGASGVRTAVESSIVLTRQDWEHVVVVPGRSPFSSAFEQLGGTVRSLGRRRHLVLRRRSSPAGVLRHALQLAVAVPVLRLLNLPDPLH